MEESYMIEYAKREMRIAWGEDYAKDPMQKMIADNVLELLQVVADQGHTNHTVKYMLGVFNRLVNYKPLTPLTGDDDEWEHFVWLDADEEQNKRYGAVFRHNHDNSTAYNIEAVLFKDNEGFCYSTRGSKQPITFPYEVPDKPESRPMEEDK